MPDNSSISVLPGHRTGDMEGREHRRAFTPSSEAHDRAWLTWRSNGCERGLKAHRVAADGSIVEIYDPAPEARRKPKAVSARQWGRC
jgi:hypothetical protein